MSKMREAYERIYNRDWEGAGTGLSRDAFEAGYQAAIAAVKEGGAKAKIVWYPSGNEVFFINEDDVTNGELLYRIPED